MYRVFKPLVYKRHPICLLRGFRYKSTQEQQPKYFLIHNRYISLGMYTTYEEAETEFNKLIGNEILCVS